MGGSANLAATAMAGFMVAAAIALTGKLLTLDDVDPQVLLAYPFLACCAAGSWRLGATGLYVGPGGVRIRRVLSTRTVEWSRVGAFFIAPGAFLGGEGGRHAIWLQTTDGEKIATPIHRRADGLVFAVYQQDIVLSPERFDRVLAGLRSRLEEAS